MVGNDILHDYITQLIAQEMARISIRQSDMVGKLGEITTRTKAANLLHVSTNTINNMIEDGRLKDACEGTMVDVRSIADYIERRPERDHQARMDRKRARQ